MAFTVGSSFHLLVYDPFSYTFSVIAISPAGEKYIYDRDASKAIQLTAMLWAVVISLIFLCHLYHLTIGIPKEQQRCLMKSRDKLFKVVNGSPTSLPNSVSGYTPNI
ncbi:hypothetical protein RHMOL_Rhmol01G0037500 [Rhododendron molle]|uniref:Uncharacterized protein n=1 Tax=Rhododendron molle TaxID=49168 RepID=A0ACC0PZ87_RHOML|nr:hypothetical protein RHMOL_Rhmol01G0037500 [Rhododendron molle]